MKWNLNTFNEIYEFLDGQFSDNYKIIENKNPNLINDDENYNIDETWLIYEITENHQSDCRNPCFGENLNRVLKCSDEIM